MQDMLRDELEIKKEKKKEREINSEQDNLFVLTMKRSEKWVELQAEKAEKAWGAQGTIWTKAGTHKIYILNVSNRYEYHWA